MTGAIELRDAGRTLYGVMLTEGRAASGGRREVCVPGSVEWPANGVGILTRHRTAPVTRAMPKREDLGRITIATAATPEIREAVADGRVFMSVEMHVRQERVTRGGVREILRALVPDVALVPDPEYDTTSAEVRRAFTGGLRTYIPIGARMDCRCAGQGADVTEIEFDAGAWDRVLGEIEAGDRKLSAISRGAGDVVADVGTGSLSVEVARNGALAIDLDPLDTPAGRDVRELIGAGVEVHARPVIQFPESTFTVDGNRAVVTEAVFSYILTKPTDRAQGVPALGRVNEPESRRGKGRIERLRPSEAILRDPGTDRPTRRRLWL